MRPKPKILMEDPDDQLQVLVGNGLYAVFYDDIPIGVRDFGIAGNPKYRRTAFVNPGHAVRLASKLNKRFKTTRFHVREMTDAGEDEALH